MCLDTNNKKKSNTLLIKEAMLVHQLTKCWRKTSAITPQNLNNRVSFQCIIFLPRSLSSLTIGSLTNLVVGPFENRI